MDDKATLGSLSARTTNLEQQVAQGFSELRRELGTLVSSFNAQVQSLSTTFTQSQKTPWATLIAAAGFMLLLEGQFINAAKEPIQHDIGALSSIDVRLWQEIDKINDHIVTRGEHEQKWASYDKQISAILDQIKEIKGDYKDIYSAKDIIKTLAEKVDRLEAEHDHRSHN